MTHVREDIGAYVLGGLDEDAERRVAAHIAECEECAQAHAEVAGLPALLDLAVVTGASDEEPLPPAIEERLLDRFAREREPEPTPKRRWRPRLALAIPSALAGAAIAVAALLVPLNFQKNAGRPPIQYQLGAEADRQRAQRERPRRAAHDTGGHGRAPVGEEPSGQAR